MGLSFFFNLGPFNSGRQRLLILDEPLPNVRVRFVLEKIVYPGQLVLIVTAFGTPPMLAGKVSLKISSHIVTIAVSNK